jgi:hypothetical protein
MKISKCPKQGRKSAKKEIQRGKEFYCCEKRSIAVSFFIDKFVWRFVIYFNGRQIRKSGIKDSLDRQGAARHKKQGRHF